MTLKLMLLLTFGERIADVAIDKLYSAFERRGINSTRGSRLKP
jgi:hypothetical protein